MARPDQEAIETFISITGVHEGVAVQKLEEHGGDLNAAINAHFNDGDRNIRHEASYAAPEDNLIEIDDPIPAGPERSPLSVLSGFSNPFSLLNSSFGRSLFGTGSYSMNREPFVTHPREVREIPIEVNDGNGSSRPSGHGPIIEDITEIDHTYAQDSIYGTVIIEDDDDDDIHSRPSAHEYDRYPDYTDDVEEEMIRAAIAASKQQVQGFGGVEHLERTSHADADLESALSLSLKTAEQEEAYRDAAEAGVSNLAEEQHSHLLSSSERINVGTSSTSNEVEDLEEPLVRRKSLKIQSCFEASKDGTFVEANPPSSPGMHDARDYSRHNGDAFLSEELEKQLAVKEALLPGEPLSEDENAVTLLVRMPDGSRCGRRFLKYDKLLSLFNFIDIGRAVKPGAYRLVRQFPRRVFSNEESSLSFEEVGLDNKQEALFLELI